MGVAALTAGSLPLPDPGRRQKVPTVASERIHLVLREAVAPDTHVRVLYGGVSGGVSGGLLGRLGIVGCLFIRGTIAGLVSLSVLAPIPHTGFDLPIDMALL